MAAFIAANHPATAPEVCEQAVDQLLEATRTSFELLTPLSLAAGRGSPAAVLAGQAVQTGEAAAYAFGNERLPLMNAMHGSLMHPGELAAAERFARDVQQRMLAAGMPAGAAESVRVAVTVHPQLEPFIYSQPMVFKTGDEWVVHCTVHPHWDYYQPGMESMRQPMSPVYSLKLKKGEAVARAMGLEGGSDAVVSAAEANEATLQQALAEAPPLFLETDVTPEMKTPLDWINGPLKFEPAPGSVATLEVTAPSLSTPTGQLPAYDRGPGRFSGNHYIKCFSPAWMHEWIAIEGLRR
ncbi:hypothetical protein CHLNCDRAFT_136887 [Chlorella variabilis]|uniref:Uncharacterized protein n=1 Tax=Chlorella variabilis TaxID=554065 RepID=E1ZUE3_CHLVA|nr:hypothetical protein CHLNCDRAFT_136887 [Chlorella variabilis]EFN50552.1 hypothetical protein CHLNCDRAFT_136887 [Chlorella variabilis]|eukprot:XP_005842684.1 hypothetical protein CHLNCDRAFT_136887 [Chlorella variabilis]